MEHPITGCINRVGVARAPRPSSDGVTNVDVEGKLMKLDDLGPVVRWRAFL